MSRRRGRTPSCVVVLLAVTVLAGCGSTVAQSQVNGTAGEGGLNPPGASVGPSALTVPGASASGIGANVGADSSALSSGQIAGGQPAAAAGRAGAESGRPSPMFVGMPYRTNGTEEAAALGLKNVSTGDGRGYWQVLTAQLNAEGGIAGHRVVPLFYAVDTTSSQPWATIDQSLCAHMTQDNHAFAVLYDGLTDTLRACLSAAHVIQVNSGGGFAGAQTFRDYRYYSEPSAFSLEREAHVTASGLTANGFFSDPAVTSAKLGVVTFDSPQFRAAYQGMAREFASAGHPVKDVEYATLPSQTSDLGQVSSEMSAASVKFASEGIDHVVFLDVGGTLMLTFLLNASSQHYHPRYGLNSMTYPAAIAQQLPNPNDQLHGAIGVGWVPVIDVLPAQEDTAALAPGARCLTLLKRHGLAPADPNAAGIAISECDEIWFLATALSSVGASPHPAEFVAGEDRLAGKYHPAGTFTARFSATQHDGAIATRLFVYDDSCSCFQYRGPTQLTSTRSRL